MTFLNTRIPCYISTVLFRSRHRPSRGRSKRNRGATRTGCGRIWPGFRDPRCKIRACSGLAGPMRASSGHQAVRRLGLIGKPSQPTHVACHGRHRDVGLGAGQSDGSDRRSHPSLPVGEAHKQACKNASHPSDECFSGRTGAGGTFGTGEEPGGRPSRCEGGSRVFSRIGRYRAEMLLEVPKASLSRHPDLQFRQSPGITHRRKAQRAFGSIFDLAYCILWILLCAASKHSVAAPETSKKLALALLTTVKFHCRIVIGA